MNIDIVTLSAMTTSDGSILEKDAVVKFITTFQPATTDILINITVYRSIEVFNEHFDEVMIHESIIPRYLTIKIPESEFSTITPYIIYEKVTEHLNVHAGDVLFKLITY